MGSKINLALTAILMLGLVVFIAPGILALNRGKILRNIAAWLAIFAALGLVYQAMQPGGLISLMQRSSASVPQESTPPVDEKNGGNQGFTPPKE